MISLKRGFKVILSIGFLSYVGLLFMEAATIGSVSSQKSNGVVDSINRIWTLVFPSTIKIITPISIDVSVPQTVYFGDRVKLEHSITPIDSSYQSIEYISSNRDIAVVSNDGFLEFVGIGELEVTVAIVGTNVSTKVLIDVKDTVTTSIILDESIELYEGESIVLGPKVFPSRVKAVEYIYESNDISVASIDYLGVLVAINQGETNIICSIEEGITAVINIKVLPISDYIATSSISLSEISSLKVGSYVKLVYQIFPLDVTKKSCILSSSDDLVAKVNGDSVLGVNPGTAIIRVTSLADPGIYAETIVTVSHLFPTEIVIENLDAIKELVLGSSRGIRVNLLGNPTYKVISFTSSDESILQVGQDGIALAKKSGVVTVTIKCELGQDVIQSAFSITVRKANLSDRYHSFQLFVRKVIGHFGAFLVLGLWASYICFMFLKKRKLVYLILIGATVACGTEIVQLFTPGRVGSLTDCLIDLAGFFLGVIIAVFSIKFMTRFKRKETIIHE